MLPQTVTFDRKLAGWSEAFDPKYRYIFVKGGRSSGKSHEVAGYLAERSVSEENLKIVCLREVQKSIKRSSKMLIDSKIKDYKIDSLYKMIETETRKLNDDGLFLFQGMNDLTADNIKSLEGFKIAWFEEAHNITSKSLKTLRPTIRVPDSQIIFTWNPQLPTDPIEEFCNDMKGRDDVLVVHVNYEDNPFLPDAAMKEIEIDRDNYPEDFNHIWLGDYDERMQGYYYAKLLNEARDQGRITSVPYKSGVDVITAWDLGMRDSTTIWFAQRVGLEWRVLHYYENNFEDLSHYADYIKSMPYNYACHYLPHDSKHERLGMKGSIKSQLMGMGIGNINTLPQSSVESGIALAKGLIKECYFDKEGCKDGLHALSSYQSRYDETKRIYKELHDWASHGADGFRYLAQAIDLGVKDKVITRRRPVARSKSWMGS